MAISTFTDYTDKKGIKIKVIDTQGEDTHTAADAAAFLGIPVSNIAKSLLLNAGDRFVLVLTPGDRRLDIEKWAKILKSPTLRMANADEVKKTTGYSIGGVPPFGHKEEIETFVETGFDVEKQVSGAAGSRYGVFLCSINELIEYSGAKDLDGTYNG